MPLPKCFCWTRFGTEAGEAIDQILARKEDERRANGGVFLWGVGNAVGPSMRELLRREASPEVVFSPIRSRPREEDVSPDLTVVWAGGRTLAGDHYELPPGSVVTSRMATGRRQSRHYALVCSSAQPLRIEEAAEDVPFRRLRNLLTDRQVGASQVTAIVRMAHAHDEDTGTVYAAAMRARLAFPYFIELVDPLPLPSLHTIKTANGKTAREAAREYVRVANMPAARWQEAEVGLRPVS